VRMQIVLASAAAGLEPPIGPVSTDFTDLDALRESTWTLKRMGFGARAAIHPAQVGVINEMFTPTSEEVEEARRLLARFEAGGRGATTDDDGRMIDEAFVRSARRILSIADS
jgi:citrate lyase subunit beta/citryl-CoA lyase